MTVSRIKEIKDKKLLASFEAKLSYEYSALIWNFQVDNWYEEVFKSHQKHKGMTQEEARIEYIVQLAEKASNFGVTYFEVKLGRDVETAISHWIGITATGINLYALEDKLEARFSWQWVEVDDLNYK